MPVDMHEKSPAHASGQPQQQIVPAAAQGLALRSAALVVRGLRDLARDSNWLVKKVFAGRTSRLAISATGAVAAMQPSAHAGARRLVLYDIELSAPTLVLSVPGENPASATELPAAFAWSPAARHLVAAWGAWRPALHIFDLLGKMLLGTFGEFSDFPGTLVWSDQGSYFTAAARGGKRASLRLWTVGGDGLPFTPAPTNKQLKA